MSYNFHSESSHGRYRGRVLRRGRGMEGGRGGQSYSGPSLGLQISSSAIRAFPWHEPDPTPNWECQGELLATISMDETTISQAPSTISEVEYIASYNWLDQKTPTILVPGSPPIWAPLTKNRKLNQDTGDIFRDQNAARYPKYPFEPAVRAIFTMQPQLRPDEVDVVACGNTMGNLLRLARSKEVDFRFNVEFIGNSVFFVRKENTPTDVIQGLYGYGHTFPQAYTQWEADTKGSASHQRIIKYKFGGTRCLIRFESDLWLPERLSEEELALAKCDTSLSKVNSEAGDDDSANVSLLDAIGSVSIGQNMPTIKDDLMIKQGGRKIPQKAVFDLKTRSFTRRIDMADVLPRLWVSQTPNFLIGYHKAGVFDEIRIEDLYQDIKDWERDNEHSLRRLEAIVRRIVEIARSSKGQGLEVSRLGNGPLLVRRLLDTTWHALPTDLCEKWDLNGSET